LKATNKKKLLTIDDYPTPKSTLRDNGSIEVSVYVPASLQHLFGTNRIRRVAGKSEQDYNRNYMRITNEIYAEFDAKQQEYHDNLLREVNRDLLQEDYSIEATLKTMIDAFPYLHPEGGRAIFMDLSSELPLEELQELRFGMSIEAKKVRRAMATKTGDYNQNQKACCCRFMQPDVTSWWEDTLTQAALAQDKPVPTFPEPVPDDYWHMGNYGDSPLTWMEGGIPDKVPSLQPRKRRTKVPTLSTMRDEFVDYAKEVWEYDKFIKCRKSLDQFIELVGDIEPNKIDKRLARQFIASYFRLHPNAAKATIGNKMAGLSNFHFWAWEKGLMYENNPFRNYKILDSEGVESEHWTEFSEEDLIYIFNQDWEKAHPQARLLLALLLITGCRLNEIASLSWRRIIQDNEMTYITLIPDATEQDVFRVKEKQGQRSVSAARREIPLHKDLILPERPADPDATLFPFKRQNTTAKANSDAHLAINHAEKDPSIRRLFSNEPKKRIHSFRSTLRQMLTEVDAPIDVKGFITGHKIGNTGSDVYDKASRTMKLKHINKINFSKINLNG